MRTIYFSLHGETTVNVVIYYINLVYSLKFIRTLFRNIYFNESS